MSYTREQIARAALEAGVGAEKIKEMLKLLPEDQGPYLGETGDLKLTDPEHWPSNRIRGIYD